MSTLTRRRAQLTRGALAVASLGLLATTAATPAQAATAPLSVGPAPTSVPGTVTRTQLGDATYQHTYTVTTKAGRYTVAFASPDSSGPVNTRIDDTSGIVPAACWASAEKLVGSTSPATGVCPILQQTQVPWQGSAYSQTFVLSAGKHTFTVGSGFYFGSVTATLVGPLG